MRANSTYSDDKALWQAFRLGDEEAYSALYLRYVGILFAYGKKLMTDEAAVEDLIQDLFIDLWQSKSRLAEVDSPKFYLFAALRRRISKSQSPANRLGQSWEFTNEEILPVTLPKEFYIIEEEDSQKQKENLSSNLKNLPLKQYEVLMLRYYQDFSYSQISEILSIHEQSVRNLVQRAVLKLRQLSIHAVLLSLLLPFFKK